MQFEAVKPTHRAFNPLCQTGKHVVAVYTPVVANSYSGTVDKGYAAALTEADGMQEEHNGHEDAVFELYKTAVRQLSGTFVFQMNADAVQVKVLEIAESPEVAEHPDGHHFAPGHFLSKKNGTTGTRIYSATQRK
jgi:hypothetical protein